MSRIKELEARRRELIRRCDAQRAELGARLGDLNPLALLRRGPGRGIGRHPLAWAAALAALLMLGRTRQVLTFTLWLRSALSLAGRVAQLVRLVSELRGSRASAEAGTATTTPVAPEALTPRA